MSTNLLKSEGKCLFCGKTFTKAGTNRHLKNHLKEKEVENKEGKSYLVKVEHNLYGSLSYFLSLWIDGETSMKDIDSFIRAI